MTRFAAYSSESSSEEEEEKPQTPTVFFKGRSQLPNDDADEDDGDGSDSEGSESSSSSGSEPSEMQEDELITSPPRQHGNKNALVEDENGDIRYAHEIDKRVSPGSASSRSSPGSRHTGPRGDTSIIPWAQQIGVDSQRMHVMQASLFRNQEEAAVLKAVTQVVKPKGPAARLEADVRTTSRKHRRDSEGDAMRYDSRERPSFAHDIEPPVFRPSRKYARVNIKSSIVKGSEAAYSDAGLSMGRSFRVAWGPGGQLVYLGSLCSPASTSHISANSSVVTITKVLPSRNRQLDIGGTSSSSSSNPASIAAKLLQHHLSHTMISRDEAHVPSANPQLPPPLSSLSQNASQLSSSSQEPLNFASFISLFPSSDASSPASIFKLGSALFDSIDLRLGHQKSNSVSPDVRNRVQILRRKASLSKWLEETVKYAVDGDLRIEASGSNAKYTPADAVFSHLTGHQINEACTKASEGGYFKLATLISQAGGDDLFKQDIQSQLEIWKSEKLAPSANNNLASTHIGLVGRGVWRIYNLLAGLVGQDEERGRPEDDICADLDWKRVFGLCLWYGSSVDASVSDVVNTYEGMILRNSRVASCGIARPIPRWAIEKKKKESQLPSSGPSRLGLFHSSSSTMSSEDLPEDPLYALIKLHADPALSLSKALNPYSFSPAGVDLGIVMCWHLYIILSRVMRVRDFSDRTVLPLQRNKHRKRHNGLINGVNHDGNDKEIVSDDDHSVDDDSDDEHRIRPEGLSPTADLLTSTYALELESWGLLQEAVFVLLHLEGTVGREKAIKDLLARSGDKLDDWMSRGLIGSLKLPATWIDEAKAMYELDCGNVYAAYELYITAQQYNAAHNIAVLELAPDAVIRKDLELLCNLFNPLAATGRREKIDGWFVRGQIFLDYARIMTRLPRLLDAVAADDDEDALPDASQADEIEDLSKTVPKIIAILPDILHRSRVMDARHPAALEEMTKDLLKLVERAKPMLLTQIQQSRISVLDGASRINLVKGIGYARFLQSIEV